MPLPPFTIEVAGPFRLDQVREVWTSVERRTSPALEAVIAETWQARLAEAEATGGMLWSAPMARLVDWRVEGDQLTIRLGPTTYRDFVGTNIVNPWVAERYGPDYLSDGCGVSALLRTADERLVLQRRSQAVFEFAGLIAACGGAVEPISPGDPSTTLAAQARRELAEELGLPPDAVRSMTLLGIGRTTSRHKPEIVYLAETTATWPEVSDRHHEEHAGLVAIPDTAQAVATTLRDAWDDYAPPGLMALTLREICRFADMLQESWQTQEEVGARMEEEGGTTATTPS